MKRLSLILMLIAMLMVLLSCTTDKREMLRSLETLEQMNRDDSLMLNDTLAEKLVAFFDAHGSANERLRAHYILGRTYYDLGELPHALETYLEAANCADTTSADCDYKTLSRVHAQAANVYYEQLQPRSQLRELRCAEHYANLGNDTLMAFECFAEQSDAYDLLNFKDSVALINEEAASRFLKVGRVSRSAQILGGTIKPMIEMDSIQKALEYVTIYESESGFFNDNGDIVRGRELYYYIKGELYLAMGQLDSAEYMYRKVLREGKTLNQQIAGSKGMQHLYELKGNSDSIAKYANQGYILNDSAYSLSEMANLQQLQASYNYNHNKILSEQRMVEVEQIKVAFLFATCCVLLVAIIFSRKYRLLKKASLDFRLRNAHIVRKLHNLANSNPPQLPSYEDLRTLREYVEKEIPSFYEVLNTKVYTLSDFEYDMCLMIRVNIKPIEIAKLKNCSPSHVSNTRKRLLKRIFNKEGGSEDFDDEIAQIR